MTSCQTGILHPIPPRGRYLSLTLKPGADPRPALTRLAALADGEHIVVGLGLSLVQSLGATVPGLRVLPAQTAAGLDLPATPHALWLWLRGDEQGELFAATQPLLDALSDAFALVHALDTFRHQDGRDLTGYEDGTENPQGDDAEEAALAGDGPTGLAGSSFAAVQQWQHDFARFHAMSGSEQDDCIGRRREDNEELEDAPESAHVKRTAQEDFEPEAFVLRRSMPWVEGAQGGLQFVAFGRTLDAFEAQWKRMLGRDDGIEDALFRFTRPINGAYYWCPPLKQGRLDLSLLGL